MNSNSVRSIFAFLGVFLLMSCVKSKDTETTPFCGITAFSVGNIVSYVSYNTSGGGTTTQKKTINGREVLFDIDQQAGTIQTVNVLPQWVNLTKVCPTFSCYGTLQYKTGDDYFNMTSGHDSLDFSQPRTLRCISTDGLFSKTYTVTLRKNTDVQDTIVWESVASNLEMDEDDHRTMVVSAMYKDKQGADSLVRRLFVFSDDASGQPLVTSTTDRSQATTWETPTQLSGADGTIDFTSITLHKGELYAIDDQGKLYKSTEKDKGMNWTLVADASLEMLLASDGIYLYALKDSKIMATDDYIGWFDSGTADLNMLPTNSRYNFYHTSYTNDEVTISMMGGLSENQDLFGVTWYKVTDTQDDEVDPWMYIKVSAENGSGCPHLQEMSTIYYGNKLYMMGREMTDVFAGIYQSEDNGISWHQQTKKWRLPEALKADNGAASWAVIDNTLYVIQKGGKIWRGTIR